MAEANKKIRNPLEEKYSVEDGQVFLTGIQALVRLPIEQMRRDEKNGLNTAAFISGYRGSPLGGYDQQLERAQKFLDKHDVKFQPGLNEELGATAVWGTQQVNMYDGAEFDGVCGIWYGKTPGVDRSTDAFRHANAAGTSKHGGVLVVAGDDHGCKSSTYPGQSEFAFVDMHMPVLNPSNVQEVLDYGLYGFELSRFSGCWVGLITLTENMDSGATVDVSSSRVQIKLPSVPEDVVLPEDGVNIRLQDTPLEQEERLWKYKRPAALAFARKNNLNKVILENPEAKLGLVTTGKAHLDLMQALEDMGIDEAKAKELGIRILKVGMPYPLDVEGIVEFAHGLENLIVLEEKRSLIEVQLKEELYNLCKRDPDFPQIEGKVDQEDKPLLPIYGEYSPAKIAKVIARYLPNQYSDDKIEARLNEVARIEGLEQHSLQSARVPHYCSGCPHNISTDVPEGSRGLAGIGCHYMVHWMDRRTSTFSQMGGEGVPWIGQAPFTKTDHVFANLGDGTYFHSGILAVRFSVASKVNITYKVLFNDAVAMTGGQRHDGELRPDMIVEQLYAEGVKKIIMVSDDPNKYDGILEFPPQLEKRHRDDMTKTQMELREVKGTTVILYDQTCATELRRRRKRGMVEDPDRRAFINEDVCEGCGDCSEKSFCVSVEPNKTEFGIKRKINQNTCNKDMSCVNGFCPSFVTVKGASVRKQSPASIDWFAEADKLPMPAARDLSNPYSVLVTGIGGTGVVTVSQLLAMAAHLEGLGTTSLDQTGLAQKGGSVYSHIRFANNKSQLHSVRIATGKADALIACDLVAATAQEAALLKMNGDRTESVLNTNVTPTSAFVIGKPMPDEKQEITDELDRHSKATFTVDGYGLAEKVMGNTTTANIFMVGYAFQKGLVPVKQESFFQAIEVNGVAIEANKQAFVAGRIAAADMEKMNQLLGLTPTIEKPKSLEEIIEYRRNYLVAYQDESYAQQYLDAVNKVKTKEAQLKPGSTELTEAVARSLFKAMAFKDEYEVARLYTNGDFERKLKDQFDGNLELTFNLAPSFLVKPDPQTGLTKKIKFGGWMYKAFKLLAKMKGLRGTAFDLFKYQDDRKMERQLLVEYQQILELFDNKLTADNLNLATQIASLPSQVKGFGHIKMKNYEEVKPAWMALQKDFSEGKKSSDVMESQVEFYEAS